MNFLAHLYLSGQDPDLIVGNFIADMVKGRKINGYDPTVVRGIQLHRQIDGFTDAHPVFLQSKERLRKKYRLYAGVVVDMYYDHFLAKNWERYSALGLVGFVSNAYAILKNRQDMLPSRARVVLPYMIENNWLVNYADLDSLQRNFGGMARRTPYKSGMENAVDDLRKHYEQFEVEFSLFFPELAGYVKAQGVPLDHHQGMAKSSPDCH